MKALAIGGGGGMERGAARTALGFDFVEEIGLADVDVERAQRFAGPDGTEPTVTVNRQAQA